MLSLTDEEARDSGGDAMGSVNNKPIAWINEYDGLESFNPDNRHDWIPVYTHPVNELTDEEILSLTGFKDNPYDIFIEYEKEDLIDFARAILRKAQGD